jgi:predicted metal-dependent hydrolase
VNAPANCLPLTPTPEPALHDTVRWGRSEIDYDIAYSAKRKTLAIEVHPDLRVSVIAPADADPAAIREKVHKRAGWIRKQQRVFELYLPKQPPRQYVNGETHRYLGRQYRLRAEQGEADSVKCLRGRFYVTLRGEPTPDRVRRRLERWYRERAETIFRERLDACHARAARFDIPLPGLKIKRLHKRWGSCGPGALVTLNLELVQAPKDCIDYVVMHELCHLKEAHHGASFWALLGKLIPDYAARQAALNRLAAR